MTLLSLSCSHPGPSVSRQQKAHDVAISSDGARIAVTATAMVIAFTRANDTFTPHIYKGLRYGVLTPRFDASARVLWGWTGQIIAIDLEAKKISVAYDEPIAYENLPIQCSIDGRYLLDGEGLIDVTKGKRSLSVRGASSVSTDFKFLCSTPSLADRVQLWKTNTRNGSLVKEWTVPVSGSINSTSVAGIEPLIALASKHGNVYVIFSKTGRVSEMRPTVIGPEQVILSEDAKFLAILGTGGVEVLDPVSGHSFSRVESEHVLHGAISSDSSSLAVLDGADHLLVYALPDLKILANIDMRSYIK